MLSTNVAFDISLYDGYYIKATAAYEKISKKKIRAFLTDNNFILIDKDTGQIVSS